MIVLCLKVIVHMLCLQGGVRVVLSEVTGTETNVMGLTPGTYYTFSVTAENAVSSQDTNASMTELPPSLPLHWREVNKTTILLYMADASCMHSVSSCIINLLCWCYVAIDGLYVYTNFHCCHSLGCLVTYTNSPLL